MYVLKEKALLIMTYSVKKVVEGLIVGSRDVYVFAEVHDLHC